MKREEIFERLQSTMVEMFELDPANVTLQSKVFEDLDLDSIDAIDLVARLHQLTGKRVSEEQVRGIRSVEDIVNLVESQLSEAGESSKASAPVATSTATNKDEASALS